MNKIFPNAAAAFEDLPHDGMPIAAGGFGLCGIPDLLIAAIRDSGPKGLTVASREWTEHGGIVTVGLEGHCVAPRALDRLAAISSAPFGLPPCRRTMSGSLART